MKVDNTLFAIKTTISRYDISKQSLIKSFWKDLIFQNSYNLESLHKARHPFCFYIYSKATQRWWHFFWIEHQLCRSLQIEWLIPISYSGVGEIWYLAKRWEKALCSEDLLHAVFAAHKQYNSILSGNLTGNSVPVNV